MDSAQNLYMYKALIAALLFLASAPGRADFCQSMVDLQNDLKQSWGARHTDKHSHDVDKKIIENVKLGLAVVNYQYLVAQSSDDIKAIKSEIKACNELDRQWKLLFMGWETHPENECLSKNMRPLQQLSYMEKIKRFFSKNTDYDPITYEVATICGQEALGVWLGSTEVVDKSGMKVFRFFLGRD